MGYTIIRRPAAFFAYFLKRLWNFICAPFRATARLADTLVAATGASVTIGKSSLTRVVELYPNNVPHHKPCKICVDCADDKDRVLVNCEVEIQWEEPPPLEGWEEQLKVKNSSPGTTRTLNLLGDTYDEMTVVDLLHSESMSHALETFRRLHDDPLAERVEAPPVRRVHAIHGTGLDTEIGHIYRPRSRRADDGLAAAHELDIHAKLEEGEASEGLKLENGWLFETETPRAHSGDGTVPYYSLNHCRTWEHKLNLQVTELPNCEHREILSKTEFHDVLLDHCMPLVETP